MCNVREVYISSKHLSSMGSMNILFVDFIFFLLFLSVNVSLFLSVCVCERVRVCLCARAHQNTISVLKITRTVF